MTSATILFFSIVAIVAIVAILLRLHPNFRKWPTRIRYVIAFLSGFAPTYFIGNLLLQLLWN